MEIQANIVAHSIADTHDSQIVTFELIYPRFILPEMLTHRVFSRNTSSSRAVPSAKHTFSLADIARPVHYGINKPGMSATEELSGFKKKIGQAVWSGLAAVSYAGLKVLSSKFISGHKQWVNRVVEPYTWTKQLVTTTQIDNFFNLRLDENAQPEIRVLAQKMLEALTHSEPVKLKPGEWHLPYIVKDEGFYYAISESEDMTVDCAKPLTLEEAIKVSVSACAQVSYRNTDISLEKAEKIFKMLNIGTPTEHSSPLEHVAKSIEYNVSDKTLSNPDTWSEGITHIDKYRNLWSGNLRNWAQFRHLIKA